MTNSSSGPPLQSIRNNVQTDVGEDGYSMPDDMDASNDGGREMGSMTAWRMIAEEVMAEAEDGGEHADGKVSLLCHWRLPVCTPCAGGLQFSIHGCVWHSCGACP